MLLHRNRLRLVLLSALLGACAPNYGENGPAWSAPKTAEGPCWDIEVSTFDDPKTWPDLFACFNRLQAFDAIEPLVLHVATSTTFDAALDAARETYPRFDLLNALEIVLRWPGSPDDPVGPALALYAEAYDRGLLPPAMAVLREASDHLARCEASAEPEKCSVTRLVRRARAEDTFADWRPLFDAIHGDLPDDVRARHETILASFLEVTSTRALGSGGEVRSNELFRFLARFLRARPEGSAFAQLLHHLQFFLAPGARGDGFAEQLVENLVPAWQSGALSRLPAMLEVLYTTTSTGAVVGYGGRTIADELLAGAERLTGLESLLRQEFVLDEGEAPVTILELALESVDTLYETGGDIPDVLDEIENIRRILCTGGRPRALCRLMNEVLPAARAAVQTGIGEIALPVLYVVHREVDIDRLFDVVEAVLELELLEETRFFVRRGVELGALEAMLDLFPTLVDVDLGRLRAPGATLLRWARWVVAPSGDARGVTPLETLVPLGERLLDPRNPGADLDRIAGEVGAMLLDAESAGSWAALSLLDDRWTRASDAIELDLSDEIGRALDDVRLADAAVALGAEARLIGLLTPIAGRTGATGYLRELVRDGVVERVLAFSAELLGFVKKRSNEGPEDVPATEAEPGADRRQDGA